MHAAQLSGPDRRIQDNLARVLGKTRYQRYIQDSALLRYADGALRVSVPTSFHRDRLDRQFGRQLQLAACEALGAQQVAVHWKIEPNAFAPDHNATTDATRATGDGDKAGGAGVEGAAPGAHRPPAHPRKPARRHNTETSHWRRLEDFIVGHSNRLAHQAALRVAQADTRPFGALCLYGDCGVGKTHLLQGIARRFRTHNPGANVRYTTAERFANEYIALIREGKTDEFRRRHRALDLLCLDDVHFLSGKKSTQSEFLHTFENLELAGARVVLASDEHPKLIRELHASIVSRVSSGMIVEIERPDRDTRARIIRALAARRALSLEPAAVDELAGLCRASVRELEGAVTRLHAFAQLLADQHAPTRRITPAAVRQVLDADRARAPRRPIRLARILEAACDALRVEASEVLGPGRHRRIVLARSLTARLARDLTNHSYPEIARALNRRNHSTIVTACQRIATQIERGDSIRDEPSLRSLRIAELYDDIRARLLEQTRTHDRSTAPGHKRSREPLGRRAG